MSVTSLNTFPQILSHNAAQAPDKIAYREKRLGIWHERSWLDSYNATSEIAAGFIELGIRKNDKIALISNNLPEIYWALLAAQAIGAIPIPLYQDAIADEIAYVIDHAEITLAIVENQEQVDKLITISDRIPLIRAVAYIDPKGLADYDHDNLCALTALRQNGQRRLLDNPNLITDAIAKTKGDDIAVILYTSGTTGNPKGVILSHDNVRISSINANRFDHLDNEEILAYLPIAWIGDHVFSMSQALLGKFIINCPESPDTIVNDLREIGPTYYFAPPRVFEDMLTHINVRMNDAHFFVKKLYQLSMKIAATYGCDILDRKPVAFWQRMLYETGRFLVYNPLRDRLGLGRIRVAYTAGEAIGDEVFRFYRSLGINLKQLYGQTEATVYITAQPDGEVYDETVGRPCPDVEIKIDPDGQVLFRSPGVFREYYKNPEATRETLTDDGWVKTGDAGIFTESGHLKIIDRAKDVGKFDHGRLFAPKYIENKLKFSPLIVDVVAFGIDRPYTAVFIIVDETAAQNWAENHNIVYASYQELTANPMLCRAIADDIQRVNALLSSDPAMAHCVIKRFLILPKTLDADDGEITRTRKVRRRIITQRYHDLIEALYDGSTTQSFDLEITFEDGQKDRLKGSVQIHNIEPEPRS